MFKNRLISGILVLAVNIFVIVLGGNILFGFIAIISLIGMNELFRVVKAGKSLLGILGYIACASYYCLLYFELHEHLMLLFISYLLLLMMIYVFMFPGYKVEQVLMAFFGLFYVGVMLSYIYQVRSLDEGAYLVWLIFIGAWGSDTCAYCVGMLIGRHKIVPRLSPKKTLEGCIGGVVGAAIIGFIYATILKDEIGGFANPQLAFTIIGAASSVISQIGDLAASAIKRNYEIKDYGRLIPGHGGILDRFDSIIFTAPIVYYLALWL